MFDYDACYSRCANPRINPLIEASPGETARTVGKVLAVLREVNAAELDATGADGLSILLLTATAALEAAAALEDQAGFWVDDARAERFRALAMRDEASVLQAIDRALGLLDEHPITAPNMDEKRASYSRVRDLAQGWLDAIDQDTGKEVAP